MPTRAYLPVHASLPAPISPAIDSRWEQSASGFLRRKLLPAKTALETNTTLVYSLFGSTLTSDTCWGQWVSDPLDGDQSIGGTMTLVIRAEELSAAEDAHLAFVLRVVKPDGTLRGLLQTRTQIATEFTTPATSRAWVDLPLTPTMVLSGDRIVLEVGAHGETPANSAVIGFVFGAPSGFADLLVNETQTLNQLAWLEFSQLLYFQTDTFLGLRDPDGLLPDWRVNVVEGSFQRQPDEVRGSLRLSASGTLLSTLRNPKARYACTADLATPMEALAFRQFLAPTGQLRKVILYSDRSGVLRGEAQRLVWVRLGTETAINRQLPSGSRTQLWAVDLTLLEA